MDASTRADCQNRPSNHRAPDVAYRRHDLLHHCDKLKGYNENKRPLLFSPLYVNHLLFWQEVPLVADLDCNQHGVKDQYDLKEDTRRVKNDVVVADNRK